jgi:hypothetical protein
MARGGCYGGRCTINKPEVSFSLGYIKIDYFLVKSMYRALLLSEALPYNTLTWKLKLPLKIKVFLWYLYKGVILTKDNLVRRQ